MKILIIRHAEPDYENNTLTSKGFVEAKYLSERLEHSQITHIYSSPLERALLTAKPTAEKINKEIKVCDWLTEFGYARISIDGEYYIPWNVMPQIWQEEKEAFDINTWKKSSLYSSVDTPEKYDDVIREFDKMLESHGVKRKNIIYGTN